ncbi:MAG TPA: PA14 domain-containing protein, partial [Segetibacter sp.]
MIHFLANRFAKKIAFGLLFLFYSNLVLAGFQVMRYYNQYNIKNIPVKFLTGKERVSTLSNSISSPLGFEKNIPRNGVVYNNDENPRGSINPAQRFLENAEFTTGPTQPEMQSFQSANNSNMVDLFTGDFSYNIPLLDVGGYPINIGYRSGISMDQEASWVGLGWNINPGTITRNMRGLPDDFNGGNDTITKTSSIKENKTVGVTAGATGELVGVPLNLSASLGIFHNNYKGWGLETGLNASLNAGAKANGALTGGLSITNNSQEGLSIAPSLSVSINQNEALANAGVAGSVTTSLSYNSRTGLKGLQLQAGVRQHVSDSKNQWSSDYSSSISFATSSYTPTITMPFTSSQYSFTGKIGGLKKVKTNSLFVTGYVSKQRIDAKDLTQVLPAYGYLHYQNGAKDGSSLLDFNREKEIPYREKPAIAHIAVPNYTYDLFSISGEGTGGMFRAYRGDIGFIHDHYIKTKDQSFRGSIDVAVGDITHGGLDINLNRSYTQNGPWVNENALKNNMSFSKPNGLHEAAYFRNPGEKAINSKSFYDSIGGDDVVTVDLYQRDINSSLITATNFLKRYNKSKLVGKLPVTSTSLLKKERDKRSQVISYLTATEASMVGFSKYIENYKFNDFKLKNCYGISENPDGEGTGLNAQYFNNISLSGQPTGSNHIDSINFTAPGVNYSARWSGRIKAPITGEYTISTETDDGVRLWINDSLFINDWNQHPKVTNSFKVNLVKDEYYNIKMEYYNGPVTGVAYLKWSHSGLASHFVPKRFLYTKPLTDTFAVSGSPLTLEKRINTFRKKDHISEITVLNTDGRRYIYGIPVYNLLQKEATFSVDGSQGDSHSGLVTYNPGAGDNTSGNKKGKDWYYNSETVPAYAHTFLLSNIVSPDYVDVAGDGITADDLGDAIKFNYSKISGVMNPFKWRAPFGINTATYNEGLKTDNRDDKGNYVYGEKELWYLHSLESKSMVATFVLEGREDIWTVDEAGNKVSQSTAKKLKEINLYSKADFLKNDINAIPIKTVHFEYSYDLCKGANNGSTGKLTLTKIWFSYNGNNKGKLNPYVFTYHNNNPNHNIKSYDKWGNYKDPLQNPGSSAGKIITNAEYPYSLQDSATAAVNAAAWALTDIKLPSGGRMKVDYESDDYAYVQNRRALEMFKVVGLASSPAFSNASQRLFDKSKDYLYVFVNVTSPVASKTEVYKKYLEGIKKLHFKLSVRMPADKYGSGYEYIPCYADLENNESYGVVNAKTIWIKIKGITK